MTYDPETRTHYCDICGRERSNSQLSTPMQVPNRREKHICLGCIDRGAYWCTVCKDVHAGLDDCPQLPLPLAG